MSTIRDIDLGTLGWVKEEIDLTLTHAASALESYTQNNADTIGLRQFINHIHQVTGTLQMVEIDGGAQLAVEIESLASAMLNGGAEATEVNLEILRVAIAGLSDHLNSLRPDRPDLPIRLMSLYNRLREPRGEAPFSEYDFFTPDLSVYPLYNKDKKRSADVGAAATLALHARREYQTLLLQWLRKADDKEALRGIVDVLDNLRETARFGAVAQLWWVGSGLVEALREDGLEVSAQPKMLLGRVDQEIRRLAEQGEAELVREPPEELVRSLLYNIAKSNAGGERITELRTAFELNTWLQPDQTGLVEEAESAPGADRLATRISEAIADASKLLLSCADPDQRDVSSMGQLREALSILYAVMSEGGSNALGDLARELHSTAGSLDNEELGASAVVYLHMLAALLLLKSGVAGSDRPEGAWSNQVEACIASLRELHRTDTTHSNADFFQTAISDLDISQLVPAMLGEMRRCLDRVEKTLVDFAEDSATAEKLLSIPANLRPVREILLLLGCNSAADLVSLSERAIDELIKGELHPDTEILESIAVAVGSVQSYLDGLVQRRTGLDDMVERALSALDTMLADRHKPIDDPVQLFGSMQRKFWACLDSRSDRELYRDVYESLRQMVSLAASHGEDQVKQAGLHLEDALARVSQDSSYRSDKIMEEVREHMGNLERFARYLASAQEPPASPQNDIDVVLEQTRRNLEATQASLADWEVESDETTEIQTALDAEVARIFAGETVGHLKAIGDAIAPSSDARKVTPELLRATHTLYGSSRSIGLHAMADACVRMDDLLRAIKNRQRLLEDTDVRLIGELRDLIAVARDRLEVGRTLSDESNERLRTLAHDISQRGAAIETELTTVDSELQEFFCEEATDVLGRMHSALAEYRDSGVAGEHIGTLRRELHTLKGGARALGISAIGDLSHNTESLLDRVTAADSSIDHTSLLELIEEVHDTLVTMIDRLRRGRTPQTVDRLNQRVARYGTAEQPAPAPEPVPIDSDAPPGVVKTPAAPPPMTTPAEAGLVAQGAPAEQSHLESQYSAPADHGSSQGERRAHVRVETELLDNLVNFSGEVSVSRGRMQEQIGGLKTKLRELRDYFEQFRDQLRDLDIYADSQVRGRPESLPPLATSEDFDPLELDRYTRVQQISRSLSEGLEQIMTVFSGLDRFTGEAEEVLRQQAHLNSELQDGLLRTRMVAFSTQVPRLRHSVRQTGRELGKQVELEVIGGDVEIDRNILERMMGPFEHMIRNSLYHGIEDTGERRRRGKSETGRITITCSQDGAEFIIEFSDDGRGLDPAKIRQRAVESGLLSEAATVSDEDLIQLLVVAGFSTADELTQMSGRGVGMDVVHNAVKQLGGSITAHNRLGEGVSFAVRLPLTLSITHALLVSAGDQSFAIPVSVVSNVVKIAPDDASKLNHDEVATFEHNGQIYPYMNLAQRLGLKTNGAMASNRVPLLLVRMGARDVALEIDELVGTREVVVKPLGSQLSDIDGIAGGTVLGDGKVVLILDLAGLWLFRERPPLFGTESEATLEPCVVMVVDDSVTVRKVTTRSLEKYGISVLTAKDGVDAMEQLQGITPHAMLVDIEMPRMDGFELTQRLRSNPETRDIPIIIITSRSGSKHKDRAMELGADVYLSKPYREEVLVGHVKEVLKHVTPSVH